MHTCSSSQSHISLCLCILTQLASVVCQVTERTSRSDCHEDRHEVQILLRSEVSLANKRTKILLGHHPRRSSVNSTLKWFLTHENSEFVSERFFSVYGKNFLFYPDMYLIETWISSELGFEIQSPRHTQNTATPLQKQV